MQALYSKSFMYQLQGIRLILTVAACLLAMVAAAPADTIDIVRDGKAYASIVVPAEPAEVDRRLRDWTTMDAAVLLQDYIQRSTGVELPIVRENESAPGGNAIWVGHTERARDALGIDPRDLPGESYRIKAFADGVAIVGEIDADGTDRGTLFGIYDFLERFAGVRWYFPGEVGTIVPQRDAITVPVDLDIDNQPYFELRVGGVGYWPPDLSKEWHPVLRFGTREGMVANHTDENWVNLYGESNPEFFGLREDGTRAITHETAPSGQSRAFLCYSEPGVLKQYLENIDNYFATGDLSPWRIADSRPQGNKIPFAPHDVRQVCQCETCKQELDPERGRYGFSSNLIFGFASRLAEELKQRHPEAVLWIMAYDHYQLAPTRVTFPDNVAVTLCLLPAIPQMADPTVRDRTRGLIESWSELVGNRRDRMVIWEYFVYPNTWFVAPTEIPHIMSEYAQHMRDKSLGWFNNGFNFRRERPHLYLTFRMVWLMHQLLWDPDADVDQLREQWCHDLFGPAGPVMDRFYQKLEDRWQNTEWSRSTAGSHAIPNDLIFRETYPPEVIRELRGLLLEARNIATADDNDIYAWRLAWFRDKAFDPFFESADEFHGLSGQTPAQRIFEATESPRIDGEINERTWQLSGALAMRDRLDASMPEHRGQAYLTFDDEYLYVAARFSVAGDYTIQAEATGINDPMILEDDKLVIHLQSVDSDHYVELVVNPNGDWNSGGGLLDHYGISGQHPKAWEPQGIESAANIEDGEWSVEVAIPWASIPSLDAPPLRMRAQFLRWDHDQSHKYESWAPTLDSWHYATTHFGWLHFDDVPTDSAAIFPTPEQSGYVNSHYDLASGSLQRQTLSQDRTYFIVGQRRLAETRWLEARGLLTFDLSSLWTMDPAQIGNARLQVYHANVVAEAPFDSIVAEHIIAGDPDHADVDDFYNEALETDRGIILPAAQIGKRGTYSIDVTRAVKADLREGRRASSFRLRSMINDPREELEPHYLIFNSVLADDRERRPQLIVETYAEHY